MLRNVSIDTIQLCSSLNVEQVSAMYKSVEFRRASKYYNYIAMNNDGESFYGVFFLPQNQHANRYYNTVVYLQRDAVNDVPTPVRDVLRLSDEWKCKRLDVAFDFDTPITKSMPLVKGNTTVTRYGNNYYLYGNNNKRKALCYDKASQLRDRGIETIGEWTRFEIRMKPPTLNDAVLCHWDFEWVEKYMKKFVWIPDIDDLNITKGHKDIIKNTIRRRVDFNWKDIQPKMKKALQLAIAEQRTEFEDIFRNKANDLFEWFYNVYCRAKHPSIIPQWYNRVKV